jgi:hypothetical protein
VHVSPLHADISGGVETYLLPRSQDSILNGALQELMNVAHSPLSVHMGDIRRSYTVVSKDAQTILRVSDVVEANDIPHVINAILVEQNRPAWVAYATRFAWPCVGALGYRRIHAEGTVPLIEETPVSHKVPQGREYREWGTDQERSSEHLKWRRKHLGPFS